MILFAINKISHYDIKNGLELIIRRIRHILDGATIDIEKNSDSAIIDFSNATKEVKNLVIKGLK